MSTKARNTSTPNRKSTSSPAAFPGEAALGTLGITGGLLSRAWNWIRARQQARTGSRRLRVSATASLGDKRFVAVVEMDGHQFLIGGGATNIVLLAQLREDEPFANLLQENIASPGKKASGRSRTRNAKPLLMPTKQKDLRRTGNQATNSVMKATLKPVVNLAAKRIVKPATAACIHPKAKGKELPVRTAKRAAPSEASSAIKQKARQTRKQAAEPVKKSQPKQVAHTAAKRKMEPVPARHAKVAVKKPETKTAKPGAHPLVLQVEKPKAGPSRKKTVRPVTKDAQKPLVSLAPRRKVKPTVALDETPKAKKEKAARPIGRQAPKPQIRLSAEKKLGSAEKQPVMPVRKASLRLTANLAAKRTVRQAKAGHAGHFAMTSVTWMVEALARQAGTLKRKLLSTIRTVLCLSLLLGVPLANASPWSPGIVTGVGSVSRLWRPAPALLVVVPLESKAPPPDPNELRVTGLGGGSAQWTIVILLTCLTLIPSVLICMTPFARLLIVFHFLRQALGLQTTPSNQTLVGLSIIMTFFLMQPIGAAIYQNAVIPLQSGKITALDALARGAIPMRQFMSHYVREKDVALFLEMSKEPRPATVNDVSFRVLLPAYILSELKAGFQIGAVLFLPFLVVDMVVASITTSVGMMQLPPVVISTPLKLLLFLMVDGWHLLIGALMRSFN